MKGLSHETSGTGTINNETRQNPSAKSYQSKGHRLNDRGGRNSYAPNQGAFATPGLTARVIIPPGVVLGIMTAGGIGVAQVMWAEWDAHFVSHLLETCAGLQIMPAPAPRAPPLVWTRTWIYILYPHPPRIAQVVPAPVPHPQKLDPHPPRTRTIFFRPAATRKTY